MKENLTIRVDVQELTTAAKLLHYIGPAELVESLVIDSMKFWLAGTLNGLNEAKEAMQIPDKR